ncbi:MAG: hypothetical protein P8P27_00750, partial [Flavobacteriaceae bacterium]|nr:hypothetical protein [Flavobacteriaceae bacterium]
MKKKVSSIAFNIFYKNLKKLTYCLLFLAPTLSFAQYDIDLFLQFNGRYDFTAIGNTLNPAPNPCNILTESSADFTLESSQSIVSAHLYWAGSGSIDFGSAFPSDRIVFLNGNEVRNTRQFQATANFGGGGGRDYFSYYADVTEHVTGTGTYTLSDFDITDNIQGSPDGPYCNSTTDFGGWSIIIIYEDPNLALNQISLFDGYELLYGDPCCNNKEIILEGIDVATDELAKIGFLAWEGDEVIANNETLKINDVPISNAQNPLNNAFNGSNSYTGSNDLFNMDLDVYDLEGIVQPDDTEDQINLTSDQDLIIINNLIISVNSELPDATIEFDPVVAICDSGDIQIDYTVFNVNSTKFLPAGVNIAFYAETTTETILLDNTQTTTSILQIGESESGSIALTIPITDPGFPDIFTLRAVVDDDGTGLGSISETNEGNNFFEQEIDLSIVTVNLGEDILIDEGNAVCEGLELEIGIVPGSLNENGYQWYFINSVFVEEEIPGATDSFLTVTETGRYILKTTVYVGTTTECIISGDILVEFIPFSPAVVPDPIAICDEPFDDFGEFDLTIRNDQIRGTQSATETTINYYTLEADADAGNANFIDPPNAFSSSSTTIYARLFANVGDCFSVVPLELEVRRPIAIETNILPYELCDNDQSGDEIFNLNTWGEDEILNGLTNVTLTYYENLTDAEVPRNEINPANAYISGNTEIWVRAESPDGCTAFNSFNLVLGEVPLHTPVPLFQLCDDAVADGFTDFDLDSKNTEIATFGGVFNPNLTVTYHLTLPDAEAGTIPSLSSPYTNITNPQPIWVRVVDPTIVCPAIFEMQLEVISLTGVVPDELFSCDEVVNDGFADFDLTQRDSQIINGQPNTFVTYYEDAVDADAGNANFIALPTAFENTTIDTQIVFARLEETILGCYDVVELVLTVNAAPVTDFVPAEYPLCDNDQDPAGIENFDFDGFITIPTGITLTYYNSEPEAIADRNPITTTTTPASNDYPSAGETIWVRAVNLDGCVTVSSFDLIIDTVPDYTPVPLFQLCDDALADGFTDFDLDSKNTEIATFGGVFNSNLTVTYHLDPLDAEAGTIPSLSSPYTNIINPESIWVRVEDATTTCFGTFEMELEVISLTGVVPDELFSCDEVVNDGFADFDLTQRDSQIINGQPNTFVTYYEDAVDADAGNTNFIALPTAFENTTIDTQIVFARLEETILGCYDVVELVLTVNAAPAITDPIEDYALCDNDEDLTEVFDLTSKYDEIVNTLADITLSYYNLETDADSQTSPILTPDNYPSTGAEVIWVRAVNLEGCATIGFFNLIIDTVPDYTPVPLFQLCDDALADGFTDFDLDSKNTEIATFGGVFNPNLTVSYHLTLPDAEAGTIPSLSSPYTNIINPESIWVRVEDATTTCFGTFEMELKVNPLPTPISPTPLILCDVDNDGFIAFDLESKNDEILAGAGVDISYYEFEPDAEAGTIPSLSSPYTNTSASPQTIFARVEFTSTGCFDIVQMDLVVNPTPIIPATITPIEICDVNLDGIEFFDLTQRANEIYGTQDPADYTLKYYTDPIDADLGDPLNAIVTPEAYQNTGNPQTIWVRLEDNLTGCYSVGSFTIDFIFCPQPDATIEIDNLGVFCVSSNIDITYTVFNVNSTGPLPANTPIAFYRLAVTGELILLGQSQTINEIPIGGSETITDPLFIPVGTPFIFTLIAVVDDDGSGTGTGIVGEDNETNNEDDITVDLDGERINLGPDIESCIGYTEVLDADLGEPGFNYQWFFNGTLISGATDPIFSATTNGTYRVTATDGVCFVEGDIVLNFNAPPIAGTPDILVVCDTFPNDEFASFDLTDRYNQIIDGQPDTFVEYYLTPSDADTATNPLGIPYTNVEPGTQTVFARLEGIPVGCYDVVPLVLQVDAAPAITDPIPDYFICDNDQDNNEIFDLTFWGNTEIINGLTNVDLFYYNNEPDAIADTSRIPLPNAYLSGGLETIWIRAENQEGCITISSFILISGDVPVIQPVLEFLVCDDDLLDGITQFDLDSQNATIAIGDPNLLVTYHTTPLDAEDGSNILTSPYTNIVNPETLYVRVIDISTGCYIVFEMDLKVITPVAVVPDDLPTCDEVPNDGFAEFNLRDRDDQIINGQNAVVTYYENVDDAEAGNPNFIAVPTAFENTTVDTQVVFARLEEPILGCFDVVELVLTVNAAPTITDPIEDYELCDNDEDLTEIFDLTSKYDEIVNTLADITLSYYNLETDADSETSPILTPDNYPSTGAEVIWFRAVNLDGCATIGFFNLIINTVPTYTEVPLYELCDDGISDGFTEFDLESQITTITNDDFNLIVTFHISQDDADTATNPLVSPYTNITDPETIFVRVEDATTGCYGSFEMILDIISPIAIQPDPLEYCDPDNDGFGEFTLTDADSQVTGGIPLGNLQVS